MGQRGFGLTDWARDGTLAEYVATVEGAVAITASIAASSIALVGFGLDSVIEGVASVIIIALSVGSLVFIPMLSIAKEQLADQIGSAATKGEGRQNMLCAYCSIAGL